MEATKDQANEMHDHWVALMRAKHISSGESKTLDKYANYLFKRMKETKALHKVYNLPDGAFNNDT